MNRLRRVSELALALGDASIGLLSIIIPWGIADPEPPSINYADDQLAIKLGIGFGLPFLLAAAVLVTKRRPSLIAAAPVGIAATLAGYLAIQTTLYLVCFIFGISSAAVLSFRNGHRLSRADAPPDRTLPGCSA